jgi:hypothetical protein
LLATTNATSRSRGRGPREGVEGGVRTASSVVANTCGSTNRFGLAPGAIGSFTTVSISPLATALAPMVTESCANEILEGNDSNEIHALPHRPMQLRMVAMLVRDADGRYHSVARREVVPAVAPAIPALAFDQLTRFP